MVDAPIQFAHIHKAIEQQDGSSVENKTHTLKGVCATLGAVYMEDSCIAIEKAARDNDFQSVLDHLLQLETQFTSIQELFKEHHM